MVQQDNTNESILPVLTGIVLGGVFGGLLGTAVRNRKQRVAFMTWLFTVDENTLQLRSYLSKRFTAYRHGLEAEIKSSAERIKQDAEATSYSPS